MPPQSQYHVYSQKTLHHGDPLYTSESDVCRRQILSIMSIPALEELKKIIIAVDP